MHSPPISATEILSQENNFLDLEMSMYTYGLFESLQYKFDSSITIEHAGIETKENETPNFFVGFFFTEEKASVASMEATPLRLIRVIR